MNDRNTLASPRSIIYQNPDFVAGMLQEMYQVGLLESSETDRNTALTSSKTTDTSGGGKASLGVSVPGLGSAEFAANGERAVEQAELDQRTNADRSRFVYSQAFYLDAVRRELEARGQVVDVKDKDTASNLKAGDIVEFSASFRPNEVNALLDIATPELVGEIARFVVRSANRKEIADSVDRAESRGVDISIENISAHRALGEDKANDTAVLATAVAHALKVDSRGDTTKEFHATITDGLAAMVMCDAAHFVSADSDRLLDGDFVVLAKVIRRLTEVTPIFSKNKVLHRIKPMAVAELLANLGRDVPGAVQDQGVENAEWYDDGDRISAGGEGSSAANEYVDLSFPSEIRNAITVMPIAIYI